MNRRMLIAGGSGFIGTALKAELLRQGFEVQIIGRTGADLNWDGQTVGPWAEALEGAFGVINLSGSPIQNHWSASEQKKILDSRVESTTAIGKALVGLNNPPETWINASAIGIYSDRGDTPISEESPIDDSDSDFLVQVGSAWEASFRESPGFHVVKRASTFRIGLVLGRDGGLIAPLARLARLGLGGPSGSGRQFFSWIHLADLVRGICHVAERGEGIYNGTAPKPVTNAEFMSGIRRGVGCPVGLPAPAFGLKLVGKVGGPDASLTLTSQRVLPEALLKSGFEFQFPELDLALNSILK